LAALALERDNANESVERLEQLLGQLPATELTTRVGALELAVRAQAVRGDVAAAEGALAELERAAATLGRPPRAAAPAEARATGAGRRGRRRGRGDGGGAPRGSRRRRSGIRIGGGPVSGERRALRGGTGALRAGAIAGPDREARRGGAGGAGRARRLRHSGRG